MAFMSSMKNVCVIGAGPAGLVAARELRKEGHAVVVLEQNHAIGGQWLYDPQISTEHPLGKDRFLKVHSSVYASLRSASPREIMGFTDFPFIIKENRDTRRFPSHSEILLYLQDFCERFGLREFIRFKSRVENVEMLHYPVSTENLTWVVTSKADEKISVEVYDAVVVATGHNSHPRLPEIKGMDSWKKRQIHSHVYRVPELFKNEVVVIVGSSMSAQDISMELVNVANEIHVSVRSPTISNGFSKVFSKFDNLHRRGEIESLHEDGRVLFKDGSWIVADSIIYCTGYSYSFPFLDTKGLVMVNNDRVGPLYEHIFPPSLASSLSFIGIPKQVILFLFFELQAKWIAQLLSGKRKLPSQDDMMKSIQEFYHSIDKNEIPKHNTHVILEAEKDFIDRFADYVNLPRLEEWQKQLFISAMTNGAINLETYLDSYKEDEEILQVAYESSHFTQFGN